MGGPLRAVVFDMDGLLFNTEELYQLVGSGILQRRGHEFTQALLDAMMGRPSPVALQIMIDRHELSDSVEDLMRETEETFPPILDAHLAPMPGAPELLVALEKAGRPKAIATSSRRLFLDNILSRVGWAERFDFFLTGDDVREGKPHPEIYEAAARRHGLPAEEILVLEDSHNGCRAAVAAGMFTVAVPGDHSRGHDFTGTKFVADSLHDRRIYAALGLA
jgi:HAD superfamily hydrolase (TIGR01509 family)